MTTLDKKAQVQEFFGAHAKEYIDSASHARGASLERLVLHTALQGDEVVLDVATGTGHNALSFAPHVRRVVGLDLTQGMLAEACGLAQQRGASNVTFCQGDSERLPFASNSFAWSQAVLPRIISPMWPKRCRKWRGCARQGAAWLLWIILPRKMPTPVRPYQRLRDFARSFAPLGLSSVAMAAIFSTGRAAPGNRGNAPQGHAFSFLGQPHGCRGRRRG